MGQDRFGKKEDWEERRLERISPVSAGIDPALIIGFLDQIREREVHLHSFMMLKGDKVFAEGEYTPCRSQDLHMIFSLSKSFTSTAVGFAVQEGRLCLEDSVADYFQEDGELYRQISRKNKEMKIRHLLTMNTGHIDAKDNTFKDMAAQWSRDFLLDPIEREPGNWFLYNTRASYMLSVIVQKATGKSVLAYLRPRLFEPLGCSRDIWWELSPEGYDAGGFGLNLRVEDIAKFGVLVKDKGVFGGKRLLNAGWFKEASKPWSDSSNTWSGENCFGYGYQFWRCHVPGSFRGDGAFGQYCVILPDQDMVFATTAGQLDMQRILDAFWEQVYDKLGRALPDETRLEENQKKLEKRIKELTLPAFYEEKGIRGKKLVLPERFYGKEYQIDCNMLQITGLRFLPAKEDGIRMEVKNGAVWNTIDLSADHWTAGKMKVDGVYTQLNKWVFRNGLFESYYGKGCSRDNKLYLDMVFTQTAYQDTWEVSFEEDFIQLSVKRNAGFDEIDFRVRGREK